MTSWLQASAASRKTHTTAMSHCLEKEQTGRMPSSRLLSNKYSNKIVTLSECGWSEYTNSRVANISEQWESGAKWSWFMPWYDGSEAVNKHADEAWWKAAMSSEFVITRDKVKF